MADYIHFKLQAEIMKRLPVISLIRFRAVSKQWKSLIDSPTFIADHCVIQHQTQSHRHLLLSYMDAGVSSLGIMAVRYNSIVDDDTFPHQKVLLTTPRSVKSLTGSNYPGSLVGVSGGLFCFYNTYGQRKHAVIWNPSIKKTLTIAVPEVPYYDDNDYDDDVWCTNLVGFGVCPRDSDPKLVKITVNVMYQKEHATIPNQVEVFSLSSGLWKPPSGKLPRTSILYMSHQVAINEFIYWFAKDMSSSDWKFHQYCRLIMSFDLTNEEFTEVYLPQNLSSSNTQVCISKLNESLVLLEKDHASNANVWIMQSGNPKSFTHIYTINTPITSIRDVAGFRKNGEPIIVKKKGLKENELIVYEPNSKQINHTGIAGTFLYFFASPYTQTLLLLDHKDSVDVDSETPFWIGKKVLGARSGHFRRVGRTLKRVSRSSLATSSSSSYYGASKRYSQEEVDEVVKKKCKIIGKRISASANKKLVNLMTQLDEKGIILDKTPVVVEKDEEMEDEDDTPLEDHGVRTSKRASVAPAWHKDFVVG